MSWVRFSVAVLLLAGLAGDAPRAQAVIRYRFTFPEPQHRWMQVEIAYTGLAATPLELRMSRSSPGRYSLHDFAKNVYDVQATAGNGRELPMAGSPKAKLIELDEQASPTAGRRFTRA